MDVLTERVKKEAPESMLFADDIVLCGDKDVDMTEYLESWRKALEERGMRVSRPKTQFMDFSFEQNAQGNRPQVKILGEEVERVTHFKYLGTSIEECAWKYIPISTSHDAYKFSFLPRTIIAWNQLPSIIITAPSLDAFRSRLITSQP